MAQPGPLPNASFAERKGKTPLRRPLLSPVFEGEPIQGSSNVSPNEASDISKMPAMKFFGKRRSQYFEDKFQERNGMPGSENDVLSCAMLYAEVKTNVIIKDEFTFIMEFSHQLAARYDRPVSSVVIAMQHGICMLFGNSFDPAYIITISALPHQVQATTNKRNVVLIQRHMEKALCVPPTRGFVRFIPVPEECTGWNEKTAMGEMQELVRSRSSDTAEPKLQGRRRMRTAGASNSHLAAASRDDIGDDEIAGRSTPGHEAAVENGVETSETTRRIRNKRSFMQAIFQRTPKTGEGQSENRV